METARQVQKMKTYMLNTMQTKKQKQEEANKTRLLKHITISTDPNKKTNKKKQIILDC